MLPDSFKAAQKFEEEAEHLELTIGPLVQQYNEKVRQRNAAAQEFNEHCQRLFSEAKPGDSVIVHDDYDNAPYVATVVEVWRGYLAVRIGEGVEHVVSPEYVASIRLLMPQFVDNAASEQSEVPF